MSRRRPLHAVGVLPEVWEDAKREADKYGETMTQFMESALIAEVVRRDRARRRQSQAE